jgi:hypothetical protein
MRQDLRGECSAHDVQCYDHHSRETSAARPYYDTHTQNPKKHGFEDKRQWMTVTRDKLVRALRAEDKLKLDLLPDSFTNLSRRHRDER